MRKFGVKQIVPVLTAAVAGTFLYICITQYGFWDEIKGPTKGFFPAIVSGALLLCSVLAFFQAFKEEEARYPLANYLVILAGFGMYLLTFFIGLLPTLVVYLIGWLKLVEKTPWKTTLLLSVAVLAVVIGVFGVWLDIQFPTGMIYEYFAG